MTPSAFSQKIQNIPPVLVLLVFLMAGAAVLLMSAAAHVAIANFQDPSKQLGYFNEVNWSVNYVLFVPLALFFFTSSFGCISNAVHDMAAAGMVVDPSRRALTQNELRASWEKTVSPYLVAGAILGIVGALASLIEWWVNFNYPDAPLDGVVKTTHLGIGWNLAPLTQQEPHRILEAKLFGLAAYCLQGVTAAAFLVFVCVIFGFGTWIYNFTTDKTGCELLPNTQSNDKRLGFEIFEPLVEALLSAALCCFGMFFLTRLDHAFLQSTSVTLGDFVQNDIWWGFVKGVKKLATADADLFQVGDIGYSVAMVGAGLALTLVMAFFIPTEILRQAAKRSMTRALQLPQSDAAARKLKKMTFWPMSYPKPIQLLGFLFLSVMCFIFYKLTLILIGSSTLAVIRKLIKFS